MGQVEEIAEWRARRAAADDVPMGAPRFILEERCPGCGAERVGIMVWRKLSQDEGRVPFPRIEPHFLCRDGRVLFQEITDSAMPVSSWTRILGRFRA